MRSGFVGDQAKAIWPQELWEFGAASVEEADKLNALADEANARLCNSRWLPYWSAEAYGFGRTLREYGYYPTQLPLCVDTDHGPQLCYRPLNTELETDSPCILVHNSAACKQWQNEPGKSCHVMSSPFVLFRRLHGIAQRETARGLLFFPAHSTSGVEERTDEALYIELLREAPADFGPAAVCMYGHDVTLGRHMPFLEAGVPVFTAGYPLDRHFTERFYSIVRHFQYAASNELGSYTFYCTELGLPFSLVGPRAIFWNNEDKNVPLGVLDDPPGLERITELFVGWNRQISPAQRSFTLSILGQDAVPSRLEISVLLYRSLLQALRNKFRAKVRSLKQFS